MTLRQKLLKAIKTYDEDEFILPLGLVLEIEKIYESERKPETYDQKLMTELSKEVEFLCEKSKKLLERSRGNRW